MVFNVEISLRGWCMMIWSNRLNMTYIGYICILAKHVDEADFDM